MSSFPESAPAPADPPADATAARPVSPGGETEPRPAQPADARAARLERFRREQRIVEFLNRGVAVAEIAARFDVGEKRMRAIIREIVDRRQPHPPEEFLAIQVSRLNEALLVAYSAMTDMNLKAVAEVRRLVRDLDRYHGLSTTAPRRQPEPRRAASVGRGRFAYGGALSCRAEFSQLTVGGIEFAPGQTPLPPAVEPGVPDRARPDKTAAGSTVREDHAIAAAAAIGP